jgi:hypothetical protein
MIHEFNATQIQKALQFIFWGSLISVIDINYGRIFAIIDIIGVFSITLGVAQLSQFTSEDTRYNQLMKVCLGIAIFWCIELIAQVFFGVNLISFGIIGSILASIKTMGVILFCYTMYRLTKQNQLSISQKHWKNASITLASFYAIMLVFSAIGSWVLKGMTFSFIAWISILTFCLGFGWILYFLFALYQTRAEIGRRFLV